jgi:hypothetical protein
MVLHAYRGGKQPMKSPQSAPIAFRFDPAMHAALHLIADRQGRSMANMMEWLIRKHCEQKSLGWPPGRRRFGRACEDGASTSRQEVAEARGEQELTRGIKDMNAQVLACFIWSIAELLRGDYKQCDYGKVKVSGGSRPNA